MARVEEPFHVFADEAIGWWDDPGPEAVPVPQRPPRGPGVRREPEPAARTLLPEFDTGCWSRFSLGGSPAPDHSHRYHVTLLQQLSEIEPQHTVWAETHARWKAYLSSGC